MADTNNPAQGQEPAGTPAPVPATPKAEDIVAALPEDGSSFFCPLAQYAEKAG